MKLYKKEDLQFVDGYLVDKEGNVVAPDDDVIPLFNQLEEMKQEIAWRLANPEPKAAEVAPFKFESARPTVGFHAEVDTPLLDRKVAEGVQLYEEVVRANKVEDVERLIDRFMPVLVWADSDEFFGHAAVTWRFDTKTIGNPLEADAGELVAIICQHEEAM